MSGSLRKMKQKRAKMGRSDTEFIFVVPAIKAAASKLSTGRESDV